jgi:isoquinoline 1-oxidoreductase alpha subunit
LHIFGDFLSPGSIPHFSFTPGLVKEHTMKLKLSVNGSEKETDLDPDMPLLWVLRDVMGLTGTKFGCGKALCGACTVHLDGTAVRSCVTPISAAAGRKITTIEGLSADGTHPLQKAWVTFAVPQCGFCQTGQIMTAAALLKEKSKPTDKDIAEAMAGNLCRCGTYTRIRDAIKKVAQESKA